MNKLRFSSTLSGLSLLSLPDSVISTLWASLSRLSTFTVDSEGIRFESFIDGGHAHLRAHGEVQFFQQLDDPLDEESRYLSNLAPSENSPRNPNSSWSSWLCPITWGHCLGLFTTTTWGVAFSAAYQVLCEPHPGWPAWPARNFQPPWWRCWLPSFLPCWLGVDFLQM